MGNLAGHWAQRLRAASGHVREPSGFTMIEVLVAMAVLLVGMLGTFLLVGTANGNLSQTKSRAGATNLARELLENARETAYAEIGQSSWFTSTLRDIPGGSGQVTSPASNSVRTIVTRQKIAYITTVSWCSADDSGDGFGAHAGSTAWCAGSGSAGTADSQAEDFKRVSVAVSWAYKGVTQPPLIQTATFAFTGSVVGPTVTSLTITWPLGLDINAPLITSNPSGGTVTFLASAADSATEAADIELTVNGVEQTDGVINNGDGTWSFDWNISSLADGIYTIGAIAVDSLGTHGQTRTLQVKLARATATPPRMVTGGYNYVYVAGVKTQVVELDWDASPEGSVTGYEVREGATVACSASLATDCIDFSPAGSGSTTYTIRTNYTDSAGQPRFVSTDLSVSAPAPSVPTLYGLTTGAAHSSSQCGLGSNAPQGDLSAAFTGGADATDTVPLLLGCLPPFPSGVSLGAGTVTFDVWYTNTDPLVCIPGGALVLVPANVTLAGTSPIFPGGTSTVSKLTYTAIVPPTSFSAGDQLVWQLNGRGANGLCDSLTVHYNSTAHQTTVSLPTLSSGLPQPSPPTDLTVTVNADGTRTLRWTPPGSSSPALDFYRIYRDGQNFWNRIDTAGATQTCVSTSQICWTDTASGGISHSYRVTSASDDLTESEPTGAVSG